MAAMTRRAVLAAVAAGAALFPLTAGCSPLWPGAGPAAGRVALPVPAPVRYGRERLRVVLSREGLPALDDAVQQLVGDAARQVGMTVEVEDLERFLGTSGAGVPSATAGDAAGEAMAQRLLATVQAGLPPDALLLLGRQGQVARFRAMGLVQDVSEGMRRAVRQFGRPSGVAEALQVVAGNWFAVPYYQRLAGHWTRAAVLRSLGLDPDGAGGEVDYLALRRALDDARAGQTPPVGVDGGRRADGGDERGYPAGPVKWGWGIGGADTPDVDAWCWGAIHAWGGGLADRRGERVTLASPETVAALQWLGDALTSRPPWGAVPPAAGTWADVAKNEAFVSGATAYTFTERALLLTTSAGAVDGGDAVDLVYLRAPAGPAARPRAVGGGAAWLLPRGAQLEPVERLLEQLLEPSRQRRLWQAGGGFALPAYGGLWDDPALAGTLAGTSGTLGRRNIQRFRDELASGGFVSATGNGGPETAASQAIGAGRLGVRMLRAVLRGRPAQAVVADAHGLAVQLFRDHGLPGT